MEPTRWNKIMDAYAHAAELVEGDIAPFLDSLPAEIRPEIEKLLAAERDAGDFMESPVFVDPEISSKWDLSNEKHPAEIDGYTIIEPIGIGGMGTVYLAERQGEGFSQKVALKVIKRGMDTHTVLRRFLTERRILADLEHPNIARMLDGGSTEDGSPYFVMEYVKGEPLRAYCDKYALDIRSRLRIFAKVCSAVNYAHQKLIVHRDIKPSNILVTEDGEPKLLDFGIAKLLNPDRTASDQAATATNFRVMTPEYASPEQLRGSPTTTLTDVYSLGVVLYELLTGIRPYKAEGGNPIAIIQAMTSREPIKPSVAAGSGRGEETLADEKFTELIEIHTTGDAPIRSVTHTATPDAKALRGDLDNIVMMAIRRESERRYQSVQEFLDDIERYLNGLPVKATEDSLRYRIGKFVGRHRAAVSAAVVVAVALIAAAAITGYQYRQASIERARAEARFAEGRKFASAVIYNHYERIKDLPGSTEAKASLIADAVNYLDAVSKDSSGDAEFQRELAKAYTKLAEIQGVSTGSGDLGEHASARASLEKAIGLLDQLVKANPASAEDQRLLARSYSNLSYLVPPSESADLVDRSFEIYKLLRSLNPNKEQAEYDYAGALWDQANQIRAKGDAAAAIKHFNEAAEIYESLYKTTGNTRYRRSASLTYKNVGSVYRVTGDPAASLASYEKALAYDKQIAADSPDNVEATIGLSFSRRGVGEALTDLKQFDRALAEFNTAVEIQESVFAEDTKNAFLADALSETYSGLAVLHRERSEYAKAESYFQKVFEMERDTSSDAANTLRRLYTAKAHLEYAELLLRRNGPGEKARSELQKALAIFNETNASGSLDPAFIPFHERAKALLSKV